MLEILWNGRGGQGAFTAARILGAAWVLKGERSYALAFPSFGPERRGAPIRAFTKLDCNPINNRSEIKKSDFVIYLDDTLFDETSLPPLKNGGRIILNTTKRYADKRVITVDAAKIAETILKRPITNTVMLGVLSALEPEIGLTEIEEAITAAMPQALAESNNAVVRAAKEAAAQGAV